MFTGIITAKGTVETVHATDEMLTLGIVSPYPANDLETGESISCSGTCLTVTTFEPRKEGSLFHVELSPETLNCTAGQHWNENAELNLERAVRASDRLGGHLVTGHIDGLAIVRDIQHESDSHVLTLEAPKALMKYIAPKGSVTLDGVSLTVNSVKENSFSVCIIPHTWQHTTLGKLQTGEELNMEVDLLARYLDRLLEERK